ncbi:hypothetical protein ACOME3_002737 [Neoechinorhynchus agilis]
MLAALPRCTAMLIFCAKNEVDLGSPVAAVCEYNLFYLLFASSDCREFLQMSFNIRLKVTPKLYIPMTHPKMYTKDKMVNTEKLDALVIQYEHDRQLNQIRHLIPDYHRSMETTEEMRARLEAGGPPFRGPNTANNIESPE